MKDLDCGCIAFQGEAYYTNCSYFGDDDTMCIRCFSGLSSDEQHKYEKQP